MSDFKPKEILVFLITVCCFFATIMLFNSCATLNTDTKYYPSADGWYSLKDMSDKQIEKLLEEIIEKRSSFSQEHIDEFWKRKREGWSFKIHDNGSINWTAPAQYSQFDIACILNSMLAPGVTFSENFKFNKDSLLIITPNPTYSNATVKMLSQLSIQYKRNLFPIATEFQLLYNQRIIHQWTNYYCYETETIPSEYLNESGTYALVCKFIGPTGCTASALASFMVIKK